MKKSAQRDVNTARWY